MTETLSRLARLVDESGLDRKEVADLSGVNAPAVSNILRGDRDPRISTVAKILEAIGCTWADLDKA